MFFGPYKKAGGNPTKGKPKPFPNLFKSYLKKRNGI
jgi:hypothetical protein